jgi:hypothetical protein
MSVPSGDGIASEGDVVTLTVTSDALPAATLTTASIICNSYDFGAATGLTANYTVKSSGEWCIMVELCGQCLPLVATPS